MNNNIPRVTEPHDSEREALKEARQKGFGPHYVMDTPLGVVVCELLETPLTRKDTSQC